MPRLLVIGDVMVDVDVYLEQTRVAPEGCPVWVEKRREQRPGGAAAVAVMAAALGAEVHLAGIAGGPAARDLRAALSARGVNPSLVIDAGAITTRKERLWVDGKLAARIDEDAFLRGDGPVVEELDAGRPAGIDAVLVADHGKGLVTERLWAWLIERFEGRPIIVDPARRKYPSDYPGATALVANRSEAGCTSAELARWRARHWLSLFPQLAAVVIKLDAEGYVLALADNRQPATVIHEPSRAEAVVDTVGAGDQFLAALGVAVASGESWAAAARLGNLAAGIKCGWRGTRPVTAGELVMSDVEQQIGVAGSAAIDAVFVG